MTGRAHSKPLTAMLLKLSNALVSSCKSCQYGFSLSRLCRLKDFCVFWSRTYLHRRDATQARATALKTTIRAVDIPLRRFGILTPVGLDCVPPCVASTQSYRGHQLMKAPTCHSRSGGQIYLALCDHVIVNVT